MLALVLAACRPTPHPPPATPGPGSTPEAPAPRVATPAGRRPPASAAPATTTTTTPPPDPRALDCVAGQEAGWELQPGDRGAIAFGVEDAAADDGAACELLLGGDPALGPMSATGPGQGVEMLELAPRSFGTFRARVRPGVCAPTEEAVSAFFTYFNDGADHDGNGLVDNSEIDLELLCGEPSWLLVSSWTDYTDDDAFLKWSYAVDLATGDLYESPSDHEYGFVLVGNDPTLLVPGFPVPGAWYEVGFAWATDRVRWFMVLDGAERTLFELDDARLVPQLPAPVFFNAWHTQTHWFSGGFADYPADDVTFAVDWFDHAP